MTIDDSAWLTEQFEQNRAHLRAVALRMLGSAGEADDAVQEAWLRFSRAGAAGVENLGGWLTTIVARVCLNMLRSRQRHREDPASDDLAALAGLDDLEPSPEQEALLADSMGPALLIVLDLLSPAERLAFVLHDLFAVPFDEIATIVGRSPEAARQLASRARRRVQGAAAPFADRPFADRPTPDRERERERSVVEAFLAASRGGDFEALLSLLDPEVSLRLDDVAAKGGGARATSGARAVAGTFVGRAQAAQVALVDGAPAMVWAPGGTVRVVFEMTIVGGRIVTIAMLADPERLGSMAVELLDA